MTLLNKLIELEACEDAVSWVQTNNYELPEAWANCKRSDWMLWLLEQIDYKDDKLFRLIAVDCARQVQHLMKDERSIAALDVAERYAHGNATYEELAAAMAAAMDAAWAAARDAAWAAAWDAAWDAQSDIIRKHIPNITL